MIIDIVKTVDARKRALCMGYDDVCVLDACGGQLIEGEGVRKTEGLCILRSSDIIAARPMIERGQVDMLTGLEFHGNKDYMHQQNSGMNHVIARLMKQKRVAYALDYGELLFSDDRCIILRRMVQNVMLCQRAGVELCVCSFASGPEVVRGPRDIMSLLVLLGVENPRRVMRSAHACLVRAEERQAGKRQGDVLEL